MKNLLLLYSLLFLISCGGNDKKSDESDASSENLNSSEWEYLEEPFGDESYLEFKVTPKKYKAGDDVKLEVKVGSAYGPIEKAQVYFRCTNGSSQKEYGMLKDPSKGEIWTEIKKEGFYINDEGKTVKIKKVSSYNGISGYTYYNFTFKVVDGKEKLELKINTPYRNIAFQAHPIVND